MLINTKKMATGSRIIASCIILCIYSSAFAQSNGSWRWRAEPPKATPPKWSFEIKYGQFEPDEVAFQAFYGEDFTEQSAISLGYKLLRTVDFGIETGYMRNRGQGQLPLNAAAGLNPLSANVVTWRTNPRHVYLVLRGVFGEDQIGVPYIGGGITEMGYEIEVDNQPTIKGTAEGSHQRIGLQFLLDRADPGAASSFKRDYNVKNTYFYIEKLEIDATVDGVQLGGETTFLGFLFEF